MKGTQCPYWNIQSEEAISPISLVYYFKHFSRHYFIWSTKKNKNTFSFISELGLRKLVRHWDSSHKRISQTQGGHIHNSILLSRKWVAAHASQPQLFSSTSCHGNVFLPSPHIPSLSLLSNCMQQHSLRGATKYIEEVVKTPHSLDCWLWLSFVAAVGASVSEKLYSIYNHLIFNTHLPVIHTAQALALIHFVQFLMSLFASGILYKVIQLAQWPY